MDNGVADNFEAALVTLKAAQPCVKTETYLFPIILICLTLPTHISDATCPFLPQRRLSP
jgi:hypothetical protein